MRNIGLIKKVNKLEQLLNPRMATVSVSDTVEGLNRDCQYGFVIRYGQASKPLISK